AGQRRAARRPRRGDPAGGDNRRRHAPRLGCLVCGGWRTDARRESENRHPNLAASAATEVITPRRTRLVRVPDLQSFRRAIAALAAPAVTAKTAKTAKTEE